MPAFEAGRRLSPGERITLAGSESAHHITEVLRVRSGDRITLFHDGTLYDAVVSDASRSSLAATVVAARPAPFVDRPIALLQAVIRPGLLDDVVHGCSPLGVSPFVFYAAERSQPWNAAGRVERLGQVALAAVEQAETGRRPTVELVADLERALARVDRAWRMLYLSPRAPLTVSALMRKGLLSLDSPIAMVVGPEGGFTVGEEALLEAREAVPVRLNTGILRSELAGFAAALIIRELQGPS